LLVNQEPQQPRKEARNRAHNYGLQVQECQVSSNESVA
jgi:hypothetical protein